jgi:hypothetical protein
VARFALGFEADHFEQEADRIEATFCAMVAGSADKVAT